MKAAAAEQLGLCGIEGAIDKVLAEIELAAKLTQPLHLLVEGLGLIQCPWHPRVQRIQARVDGGLEQRGICRLIAAQYEAVGLDAVGRAHIFTGFSADGGNNFTVVYSHDDVTRGPSRNFAVLASGSTTDATSGQFLLDLDALQRITPGGSGEGACSSATRLGFYEAETPMSTAYSAHVFDAGCP